MGLPIVGYSNRSHFTTGLSLVLDGEEVFSQVGIYWWLFCPGVAIASPSHAFLYHLLVTFLDYTISSLLLSHGAL